MPRPRVVQKTLCYVVDNGRLLVFRHVDEPWEVSGLQVPAGTIRAGERVEAAALREAAEETGLTALHLVRKLGETRYDMAPYRDEVHHRHVFHLGVDAPPPERWSSLESDPSDGQVPVRLECFWIPLGRGHLLVAGQGALLAALVGRRS